jgi:hypothetical protein
MSTGNSKNRPAGAGSAQPPSGSGRPPGGTGTPPGGPGRPPSGSGKPPGGPGKPEAGAAPSAEDKKTGRVKFDERGNAVWEWSVATGAFGREISTDRLKKLENSELSLADDAPTPLGLVQSNPLGAVKGYNPYDSGKLGSTQAPKKTDLRKLGDWLKLKKQAASNKDEN